jgi:hypothetical protein
MHLLILSATLALEIEKCKPVLGPIIEIKYKDANKNINIFFLIKENNSK